MSSEINANTGGGNIQGSIIGGSGNQITNETGDRVQGNKGDVINQSGSFGVGVNKDTANAQDIAVNINQSQDDEIKQLIESLRQQIQALENQAARSEAQEHLNDLETEIIESSTPKQSRLKASLIALWSVAKDSTLVANALTALAARLGFPLPI